VTSPYSQYGYRVGFDWGPVGAAAVRGELVAVVDVLSFTTAVTVAADKGIEVLPYRWRDESAAIFAKEHEAALAVGRGQAGADGISLSTVLAVSLRNAPAAAAYVATELAKDSALTAVAIAAGERWTDGSLRPAIEDLWGAGAFLAALADSGVGPLSPEARGAAAAYREVAAELPGLLYESAGGRELTAYGFAEDVEIAGELGASQSVPVLRDGVFRVD
jgi:2-phosphosulfolactate phosphatase